MQIPGSGVTSTLGRSGAGIRGFTGSFNTGEMEAEVEGFPTCPKKSSPSSPPSTILRFLSRMRSSTSRV